MKHVYCLFEIINKMCLLFSNLESTERKLNLAEKSRYISGHNLSYYYNFHDFRFLCA